MEGLTRIRLSCSPAIVVACHILLPGGAVHLWKIVTQKAHAPSEVEKLQTKNMPRIHKLVILFFVE